MAGEWCAYTNGQKGACDPDVLTLEDWIFHSTNESDVVTVNGTFASERVGSFGGARQRDRAVVSLASRRTPRASCLCASDACWCSISCLACTVSGIVNPKGITLLPVASTEALSMSSLPFFEELGDLTLRGFMGVGSSTNFFYMNLTASVSGGSQKGWDSPVAIADLAMTIVFEHPDSSHSVSQAAGPRPPTVAVLQPADTNSSEAGVGRRLRLKGDEKVVVNPARKLTLKRRIGGGRHSTYHSKAPHSSDRRLKPTKKGGTRKKAGLRKKGGAVSSKHGRSLLATNYDGHGGLPATMASQMCKCSDTKTLDTNRGVMVSDVESCPETPPEMLALADIFPPWLLEGQAFFEYLGPALGILDAIFDAADIRYSKCSEHPTGLLGYIGLPGEGLDFPYNIFTFADGEKPFASVFNISLTQTGFVEGFRTFKDFLGTRWRWKPKLSCCWLAALLRPCVRLLLRHRPQGGVTAQAGDQAVGRSRLRLHMAR